MTNDPQTPNDWHSLVYGKEEKSRSEQFDELVLDKAWDNIRRYVIRRDHQMCRRCDKKFPYADLTIHHIKPRSEGGEYKENNLISLCSPCHDFVEIQDNPPLRSKADIEGSMPIDVNFAEILIRKDDERPSWHSWVYGGKRNPNL